MSTLIIAVISITFLYFFLALTRLPWRLFKVHICVICASVALTWLVLLVFYLLGYAVDPIVLAILMGGSVVGIMYRLQDMFLKKGWQRFWIFRWSIIIFGLIFVWSILRELWFLVFATAAIGIVWTLVILPSIKKLKITVETEKVSGISESKKSEWERARAEFEEKMKKCCD